MASSRRKQKQRILIISAAAVLGTALLTGGMFAAAGSVRSAYPAPVSDAVQQYYETNKAIPTTAPLSMPVGVFIGDSYTNAAGATTINRGWAAVAAGELGWMPAIAADSSSGYITKGHKGLTVPDLIAQTDADAKFVVLANGYNDFVMSGYAAAVGASLDQAKVKWPDAKMIVIGPWAPDAEAAAQKVETRDIIAEQARARGIAFIDPIAGKWLDDPALIGDDGLHPNDAGHEAIGKKAAQAIKAAIG